MNKLFFLNNIAIFVRVIEIIDVTIFFLLLYNQNKNFEVPLKCKIFKDMGIKNF